MAILGNAQQQRCSQLAPAECTIFATVRVMRNYQSQSRRDHSYRTKPSLEDTTRHKCGFRVSAILNENVFSIVRLTCVFATTGMNREKDYRGNCAVCLAHSKHHLSEAHITVTMREQHIHATAPCKFCNFNAGASNSQWSWQSTPNYERILF